MAKGDSPFATGFASRKIDHNLKTDAQMKKYKTEEALTSKGEPILPYEMANLPTYYADMVEGAISASKNLEEILKNPNLVPEEEEAEELRKLKNNTDKIIYYLLENVDKTLSQFTIQTSSRYDQDTLK